MTGIVTTSGLAAPVSTRAAEVPQDQQLEKLEKFVHVTDNIDGAISGPARMVIGTMEMVHAHSMHDVAKGANQVLIGLSSAVYGTIGTLVTVGAVATAIGLSSVGLVMASTALVIGGTTAAGFAGGATALLKGVTQIKNDPHKLIGVAKAGIGVGMLVGAATGNPVLITLGGVTYMVVSAIESRHEIASGLKKAWSKVQTMGSEMLDAYHDPAGTQLKLDAPTSALAP